MLGALPHSGGFQGSSTAPLRLNIGRRYTDVNGAYADSAAVSPIPRTWIMTMTQGLSVDCSAFGVTRESWEISNG